MLQEKTHYFIKNVHPYNQHVLAFNAHNLDMARRNLAEQLGWRMVARFKGKTSYICRCHGCEGKMVINSNTRLDEITRCRLNHTGSYGGKQGELYRELVAKLRSKRLSLGLSQEDVTECTGLGDGHINKLEAFHRIAALPTLVIWTHALGIELVFDDVKLPRKTQSVLSARAYPLRKCKRRISHDK